MTSALAADGRDPRPGHAETGVLRALTGMPVARPPVWFMRQAGRSLPEYRAARGRTGMLQACLTPDLAAELTVQPVRRHRVDAAILFSDIMVPVVLAGVPVRIVPGRGPVTDDPVRSSGDVRRLTGLDEAALAPVERAASLAVSELSACPLIGFAGGPFTVASYLVEGGPSRDQLRTRALMHSDPGTWHALARWVADIAIVFLRAQVRGGARAVQVFDSWIGALSRSDYRTFVLPHTQRIFDAVAELEVPRVHFGVGTAELLWDLARTGADAIGVDHRIGLQEASRRLGGRLPVQGNIDPAMLFAGQAALHRHVEAVVAAGRAAPGHVVNLGHGVPPDADPGVLTELVSFIHEAVPPRG